MIDFKKELDKLIREASINWHVLDSASSNSWDGEEVRKWSRIRSDLLKIKERLDS